MDQPTPDSPTNSPPGPFWRREPWRWAAGSFLLGVVYSLLAMAVGAEVRLGERDLTLLAGAVVEVSFAGFGYLVGSTLEARRRERAAAERLQSQMQQLTRIQARLAQTEKLASLGQLASAIAHEVRNPLAILRSLVQNLEEALADDSPDAGDTCAVLLEEIDRLAHVTSSLVAFARPPVLERTRVDAVELVERTRLLAHQLLRDRPVRLEVQEPAGESMSLDVDPDLLCQVLLGLVDNAAEAAPPGSAIRLACRRSGASVELAVADAGPGVPEDLRATVFDPFVSHRPGGTGLGLAVARQIVEAHGGRIEVGDSRALGGAELRVLVPRIETESAA